MKKSFVLYQDQRGLFEKLSNKECKELILGIFDFNEGKQLKLSPLVDMAFTSIGSQLQRDMQKYNEIVLKRKEFGKRGGLAKATKSYQELASVADNDNVNDNVNDKHIGGSVREEYWDNHIQKVLSTIEGISPEVIKESRAAFVLYDKAKLTPGYIRGILNNKKKEFSLKGGSHDATSFRDPFSN